MPAVTIKYEKDELGREYAVVEDVPVFDEHVGDDGVKYTPEVLAGIAKTCNDRIDDTGDYCPLVTHHTPEDKDPSKQPEIIGFAGPYRLAKIGKTNPRWAIVARFRVFADRVSDFQARPRRSVEIWPEANPAKRYFDPIALLGAETPRRDLGLLYSRLSDVQPLRYEMAAAFPGAMNTAPPQPQQFDKGSPMLSPEDISQIVQSLRPVIEEIVDSRMSGQPSPDEPLPQDDVNPAPEGDEPEEPVAPEGDDTDAPPMDSVMPGDLDDEAEPTEEDEDAAPVQFAKACDKYRLGSDDCDCDGAKQYMASMPQRNRRAIEKFVATKGTAAQKAMYAKVLVDVGNAERYSREREIKVQRYEKAIAEEKLRYHKLSTKYQRLQSAHAEALDAIATTRHKLRYAKFDSELSKLEASGLVFDRGDEMAALMGLTDDLASKHLQRMAMNYQKMPTNTVSPDMVDTGSTQTKSQRYAKPAADAVEALRKQKVQAEYGRVLDWMVANNTDRHPTKQDLGL